MLSYFQKNSGKVMAKIICKKCGKPIKENTDGNLKYCQGH
jgi:hypothetical protein